MPVAIVLSEGLISLAKIIVQGGEEDGEDSPIVTGEDRDHGEHEQS